MGTTEDQVQSIIEQPIVEQQVLEAVADVPQTVITEEERLIAEMTPEEIDAKAKSYGWNPEYDGANKKSAKEFLEVGQKLSNINALKDKKRLEKENEILRKSQESLMQTSAETIKKIKADTDRRIQELEAVKKDAKENLDIDGFEKATNEQIQLKEEKSKLENAAPPIDPSVHLWAQENEDFVKKVESDKVLSNYTDSVALEMRPELMKLPAADRFEAIKKRVMEDLPHKFTNPNQQQAPRTLTMNRTQTPQKADEGKVTLSTLPKDVKEGYEVIVKAKRFKTDADKKAFDDKFLENYKAMKGEK